MKCGSFTSFLLGGVLIVTTAASSLAGTQKLSDQQLASLEFEQKLGSQVSLELPFRDENGREVRLGDYFGGKPVILVLGYYECPMLCTLVLNGMVESLEDLKWNIGDQFDIVNISIDPREGPALAAIKKQSYLKRYGRKGAGAGWHFLTGREPEIRQVASQVGFPYLYDPASGQYAHPSGLVFLSPQGRVVRYQFGVVFKPAEMLASLQQARTGRPASPVQKLVFLCFHYNPITGKYGPAIMLIIRVMALATVVGLCLAIGLMVRRQKAQPRASKPQAAAGGRAPP